MDYKNQSMHQQSPDQAFFTAGAGNDSPIDNNFEPENNLDLTNEAASWSIDAAKQRQDLLTNPHPENPSNNPMLTNETVPSKTINIELPPNMQTTQPIETLPAFDAKSIRTDGDHISGKALAEISNAIEKLSQTGNTADFYATVRGDKNNPGMLGANLKQSFGREVA